MNTETLIKSKIPGKETGIEIKRTICDMCSPGVHCGIDAYIKKGKVIKIEGTDDHPINKGLLCTKGLCNREFIYREDRLRTPLKRIGNRGEGKFKEITWDEAYKEISDRLNKIKLDFGPEQVAFFTGYPKWYRPFLQRFAFSFGSPNYATESSSCATSAKMAGNIAAGRNFTTPDLQNTKTFLGWGFNSYYSKFLGAIPVEKKKREGMKVIIVDPRITPSTQKLADIHLRPRPGTDGALALGMAKLMIDKGYIDREYIEKYTFGFEDYKYYVERFDLKKVSEITGVDGDDIERAVDMLSKGPFCINESAAPIVHHQNGFQNYRAMMSLSAITGNYDRKGGNLPKKDFYAGSLGGLETYEANFVSEVVPDNMENRIGAKRFPLWNEMTNQFQAMDLARQLEEKEPYDIKALYCHGLNPRMFPNTDKMFNMLESVEFFVVVDLFMTDAAKFADIVLPACSSFEREECKSYQGGYITYTNKAIEPLYDSKSDVQIISELANYMDLDDNLIKAGYEESIRYMLSGTCADIEELKKSDLPIKCKDYIPYVAGDYTKSGYDTNSGKFELKASILDKYNNIGLDSLPTYKELNNKKSKEFPYTLTAGARIPNAIHSKLHPLKMSRALKSEATLDISKEDAMEIGISNGDIVKITTRIGGLNVKANITERVMNKNVHMYHGYPEADVNSIVCDDFDPYSGFPAYRSCLCKIEKV